MKARVLFLLCVTLASISAKAQSEDYCRQQAIFNMKLGDVDKAVIYYAQAVDKSKENRSAGKGVSGNLLAEYAYALALHHDFEAALMNIDRAMALEASNGLFFAGQILTLMGHGTAAFQLTGISPNEHVEIAKYSNWIDGIYQNLTPKYSTKASIIRANPQETLKRASALAERGQMVQAIVLFEELMEQYPDAYIVPASYSVLLEKRGNNGYAASLLKKSIGMMDASDTTGRVAFVNHLKQMETISPTKLATLTKGLHMIVYTGASFGKGVTSLNGRIGVSNENKLSMSLNANVMFLDSLTFGNIGLSAYKTWKFFVFGLGVSRQLSKLNDAWGLAPSVGLTFINKSQSASLDITFAGQIPLSGESKQGCNLSIGTTFYIDVKKRAQ